ncbi:MAG: porin [Rickettsiales bacterium]|nr:porin [Rickettsiales bacterium]
MNKKFYASLLLSTALFTLSASADYILSNSNDFKVTLGFDTNFQGGARFQSKSKTKQLKDGQVVIIGPSANNEDVAFNSSAHAHLGAENKTKSGTTYGVHVGIFASTRGGLPSRDYLGRTYGFLENNNWGRFEFGTKKGASTSMQIDGDEVAAGSGGFAGDWDNYLSLNSYQASTNYETIATNEDNFTTGTELVIKDSSSSANNEGTRKITYYTPKYNGLQLGISYIPDEANRGGNKKDDRIFVKNGPTRKLKNAFMGAVAYDKKIDDQQSFRIVLVGETGTVRISSQDKSNNRRYTKNPVGYSIGGVYYYDKFGVAGSYGSKGKFPYRKGVNAKRDYFLTAGVSYQITDKIKTSLTYFHSDNRNKLDIISVGANYSWMPGVQPYVEATYVTAKQKYNYDPQDYNSDSNNDTDVGRTNFKNRGAVVLTGVRINI